MQTSAWKHKRFILTVFAVTCDRNMEKKCRFFNLKFQFLFEIKETYFISELSWFETSIQYSESFNRLDEHVPHCCLSDIYKLQSCCSRLCLILFWTKLITCRLHLHNFFMDLFQISPLTLRAGILYQMSHCSSQLSWHHSECRGPFLSGKQTLKSSGSFYNGEARAARISKLPLSFPSKKMKKGFSWSATKKGLSLTHGWSKHQSLAWTLTESKLIYYFAIGKGWKMFSCTLCVLGQKRFLCMRPLCRKMKML